MRVTVAAFAFVSSWRLLPQPGMSRHRQQWFVTQGLSGLLVCGGRDARLEGEGDTSRQPRAAGSTSCGRDSPGGRNGAGGGGPGRIRAIPSASLGGQRRSVSRGEGPCGCPHSLLPPGVCLSFPGQWQGNARSWGLQQKGGRVKINCALRGVRRFQLVDYCFSPQK